MTVAPPARAERAVLELLQYEFAPRFAAWRAWRVPAALSALIAIIWLVGLNVDAWLMRREERALRAHLEATLREAFPTTPVVLDPLQQMRRGVADLRALPAAATRANSSASPRPSRARSPAKRTACARSSSATKACASTSSRARWRRSASSSWTSCRPPASLGALAKRRSACA